MTARDMRELQIKAELEMFYLLSVDEAVLKLSHLLQPKDEDCES